MTHVFLVWFTISLLAMPSLSQQATNQIDGAVIVPPDLARYFVVFLKPGLKRDQSAELTAKIQRAHLEYIQEQRNKGIYVVAGPFENLSDLRGLIVIDVPSEDDARRVMAQDPAVRAGRLVFEVHPALFPRSEFSRTSGLKATKPRQ